MKNICIIPARGGSKRIPRKNIKDFLGKPIIAYSIEAALNSGLFSEVMVSTDDQEIAEIAIKYGAKVPFMRSLTNADDYATLSDVIEEVKEYYIEHKFIFDNICCILATAPFVNSHLIDQTYLFMKRNSFDSIRPVVQFSSPPQRGLELKNGALNFVNPEYAKTRTQELEPIYYDAGLFYWMNFEVGLKGTNKGGFVVSERLAQDIDTEDDWEMAELKFKLINNA
ncbi:pseudaminic acid cytidylyltransferase [Sphingobacterium faecium]|uniref:pseudaminic acid cytidylyltransferase n=1 Tax=Sphingobacterium faecium TaxID=34087 RepID=UPI00246890F6|nr:pseudaminic acid cytidylyltransferase [Sphingobacterium faecium]MDH5828675.1 pseudaminic acid cytidylyltransferase [Sphingobacterium faecium]